MIWSTSAACSIATISTDRVMARRTRRPLQGLWVGDTLPATLITSNCIESMILDRRADDTESRNGRTAR